MLGTLADQQPAEDHDRLRDGNDYDPVQLPGEYRPAGGFAGGQQDQTEE